MLLRPVDASGDILPVLVSSDLLSGPEAVAQLVQYRLSLLRGEWWENPENGFFILDTLQGSRISETDASVLSAQITAYVRETSGVRDVEDVRFSVEGRQFSYSGEVKTEEGKANVKYATWLQERLSYFSGNCSARNSETVFLYVSGSVRTDTACGAPKIRQSFVKPFDASFILLLCSGRMKLSSAP